MKDDYLWDRSGDPDPEIQQLEEILGTLRYQRKPLQLAPRRNYVPLFAIAATVAIALLAGGLWLRVESREGSIPSVAVAAAPRSVIGPPLSDSSAPAPLKRKPVVVRHDRSDAEALAAKQQLMFALRLASEKLNLAYRRTQTSTQIKNQHKAG